MMGVRLSLECDNVHVQANKKKTHFQGYAAREQHNHKMKWCEELGSKRHTLNALPQYSSRSRRRWRGVTQMLRLDWLWSSR